MSSESTISPFEGPGLIDAIYSDNTDSIVDKLTNPDNISRLINHDNSEHSQAFLFGFVIDMVSPILDVFEKMTTDHLLFEFKQVWGHLLLGVIDLFIKASPRTMHAISLHNAVREKMNITKSVQDEKANKEIIVRDFEAINTALDKLLDCAHKSFSAHLNLIKEKKSAFFSSELKPPVPWFKQSHFTPKDASLASAVPLSIEEVWFNIEKVSKDKKLKFKEMIWSQINYLCSFTLFMRGSNEMNRRKAVMAIQSLLRQIKTMHEQGKVINFVEIFPAHLQEIGKSCSQEDQKELLRIFMELFQMLVKPIFQKIISIWNQIPQNVQPLIEKNIRSKIGKDQFSFKSLNEQFDSCFDTFVNLYQTLSIEEIFHQSDKVSKLLHSHYDELTPACLK